jgi:hypothetical protein
MEASTAMPLGWTFMPDSGVAQALDEGPSLPVEKAVPTTRPRISESPDVSLTFDYSDSSPRFEPPVRLKPPELEANSVPIQIWEGTVVSVDQENRVMTVFLDAKMGQIARHTGEIDLEWVSEQDADLVRPGAVFYLTLFKRTSRGSIQNAQELRFRRRPSWSAAQMRQLERDAAMIRSKMKEAPFAE